MSFEQICLPLSFKINESQSIKQVLERIWWRLKLLAKEAYSLWFEYLIEACQSSKFDLSFLQIAVFCKFKHPIFLLLQEFLINHCLLFFIDSVIPNILNFTLYFWIVLKKWKMRNFYWCSTHFFNFQSIHGVGVWKIIHLVRHNYKMKFYLFYTLFVNI